MGQRLPVVRLDSRAMGQGLVCWETNLVTPQQAAVCASMGSRVLVSQEGSGF